MLARGLICALALGIAPAAGAGNLWLVDEDRESGFAVYRSGEPDAAEVRQLCELGIRQIAVLSGDSQEHEAKFRRECPELEVVYDHRQDVSCALTSGFLSDFDRWVEEARREGRKIVFRCRHGAHRTGRLAAYYQMKYRGLTLAEALALMRQRGKLMGWYWGRLEPQVVALKNHIDGERCELTGSDRRFCVVAGSSEAGKCAAAQSDPGFRLGR